jgi:hypothetical protein
MIFHMMPTIFCSSQANRCLMSSSMTIPLAAIYFFLGPSI